MEDEKEEIEREKNVTNQPRRARLTEDFKLVKSIPSKKEP